MIASMSASTLTPTSIPNPASTTSIPSNNEPVLLSNLRTALSHLYSLNSNSTSSPTQNSSPHYQKEANTYLIDFQSRNIRRKVRSVQQRKADSPPDLTTNGSTKQQQQQHQKSMKLSEDRGSSFYACLPLLFNTNLSPHQSERLFCSQTILHRLRRMKLSEALDWEIEFQNILHEQQPHHPDGVGGVFSSQHPAILQPHTLAEKHPHWWAAFCKFHGENLSTFNVTFLGQVLNRYYQDTWACCCVGGAGAGVGDGAQSSLPPGYVGTGGVELEERIKGEMTLLILASAAYFSVYTHTVRVEFNTNSVDDSTSGSTNAATANDPKSTTTTDDIRPFLQNIFSAMALIAMRLRYTPNSVTNTNTTALSTPIVALLIKTLEHVGTIAYSLPIHQIIPPPFTTTTDPHQQQQHYALYHQTPPDEKQRIYTLAINRCICDALTSIPDSLMGSPGGARGRLSIDPRCLSAASLELRTVDTGVRLIKDALLCALARSREGSGGGSNNNSIAVDQIALQHQILIACERWAKFVPLPMDFVEETVPLVVHVLRSHSVARRQTHGLVLMETAAFAYIIRIYEGACMTTDQIIAASVGLSSEAGKANRQQGSKRQSSKSKKRHKERVQEAVNSGGNTNANEPRREEAEREHYHRGMVACCTTSLLWDTLQPVVMNSLEVIRSMPHETALVEGEGPIGCVCALASSCLPHLIKYHDGTSSLFGEPASVFFCRVMDAFKSVCFNTKASIRALSFEHIVTIYSTLLDKTKHGAVLSELESTAMHGICACALALASSCAYPPEYFSDLTVDNDEDLEIERNDIRDILRSITSFGGNEMDPMPLLSYMILDRILQDCADRISSSPLPPETAVHTLSSLAKPLNRLAQDLVSNSEGPAKLAIENILIKALASLHSVCSKLLLAFSPQISLCQLIPVSRLACIAIAALSPCFSSIAEATALDSQFISGTLCAEFQKALGFSFLTAYTCVANIPELIAASTLESTMYDIRGTMRGPGGEDHVGCIALMRCASESNALAIASLKYASLAKGVTTTCIIRDLCLVHGELHNAELERGPNICHGKGVTPISRRVLLIALSRIGVLSINNSSECAESITNELYQLLQSTLLTMRTVNERADIANADKIFQLCEASFDLSSFPSSMISSLFSSEIHNQEVKGLVDAGVLGYEFILSSDCTPSIEIIQWGRLRGSILCLLRASANPGLPALSTISIIALNQAECQATSLQCIAGPLSQSPVFNEAIICDDVVAAGAFIVVVRDTLDNIRQELGKFFLSEEQVDNAISSCIFALIGSKDSIFSVLSSESPEAQHGCHIDPRPTISEAWFLAMVSLFSIYKEINAPIESKSKELIYETLALCVHLLLHKRLDKEEFIKDQDNVLGMSLDGPQSLAMIDFIHMALATGPDAFISICERYKSQAIFDSPNFGQTINFNPGMIGGGIITAALFRGCSGALPPWVIESLPKLFAALFTCCGDTVTFCSMMATGADLRLKDADFARVRASKKLAGYYFDKMGEEGVSDFLTKVRAICSKNDNSKWRDLKVLLKAVCGGKKKASTFNLKPQPTNWECLRV